MKEPEIPFIILLTVENSFAKYLIFTEVKDNSCITFFDLIIASSQKFIPF